MSNTRMNNYSDYCNMAFCSEISSDDFFTFKSVADLVTSSENNNEIIIKIRTIGILSSTNGKFYIKDVDDNANQNSPTIQVSMNYIKYTLPSTVLPYTVQIFGSIQWKNAPVIYAKIVQVLNTTTALKLSKVMKSICSTHLALFRIK